MTQKKTPKKDGEALKNTSSKKEQDPYKKPSYGQKKLEEALKRQGQYRYNTVLQTIEVKDKWAKSDWTPIDDYTLNTLCRVLKQKDVKYATPARVAALLLSSFANKINPIREYFQSLSYLGSDPISTLADTVVLSKLPHYYNGMFRKYLSKWMTGAVANVFTEDRCANHLCLILCGKQGTFKSTWIRELCPPKLKSYYIEGGIDPDNKDSLIETTMNFIVNLDDYFAGISKNKIHEFKGFITKNTVKVRRPYSRYPEEMQKICSFIASSNESHFLHDTTGNRRFLAFEIERIDIKRAMQLDMDQAWAQAYHLFQSDFQYWLTDEDKAELQLNNEHFEVQSVEYELLILYLRPPNQGEGPDATLTNAQIQTFLQQKTSARISRKKLGEALAKAGFPKRQKQHNYKRTRVYEVIYTDEADLNLATMPFGEK